MTRNTHRAAAAFAGAVAVAATLATPLAANADTFNPFTVTSPAPTGTTIGDGVWAPSHDESQAIIPLCTPLTIVPWLIDNFGDHFNDIGLFVGTTAESALRIASLSVDPWTALRLVLTPVLQVPVYAINDTTFHVPATLGDILSFCASARA